MKRALLGVGATMLLVGCGSTSANRARSTNLDQSQVAVVPQQTLARACGTTFDKVPGSASLAPSVDDVRYASSMAYEGGPLDDAVLQIRAGREAIAGTTDGNYAAAREDFSAALQLLRTAGAKLHSAVAPPRYWLYFYHSAQACNSYIRAIYAYESSIRSNDPALLKIGDGHMKVADWYVRQAQREFNAQQAHISAIEAMRYTSVSQKPSTGPRTGSAGPAVPVGSSGHASVAVSAKAAVSVRLAASFRSRVHITVGSRQQVASGSTTDQQVLADVQRLIAQQDAQHLLYAAGIPAMAGWTSVGSDQWVHYAYAQPVDGLRAILTCQCLGASTFTSPYRVHSTNYAVEARIRVDGYASTDANATGGFGIFIRAAGPMALSGSAHGFLAGVIHVIPPHPLGEPTSDLSWAGITAASPSLQPSFGSTDFRPNLHEWHLYRVEVVNGTIRLLIDGMQALQYSSDQNFLDRNVGLFSIGANIDVADFKVVAL